jgi:hypothetical protein
MELDNELAYLARIVFLDTQIFVKFSPVRIPNGDLRDNRDVDAIGNYFLAIRGWKVEVMFRGEVE